MQTKIPLNKQIILMNPNQKRNPIKMPLNKFNLSHPKKAEFRCPSLSKDLFLLKISPNKNLQEKEKGIKKNKYMYTYKFLFIII